MEQETEDEYPSIREALNNDSKVANAYCGIKYLIWQVGYVLFTIVGGLATIVLGLVLAMLIVAEKVWNVLSAVFGPVVSRLTPDGEKVDAAGERVGTALKSGHEKSKETPGLRRLWGECPVSISQEPKWFGKAVTKVENTADRFFH